VREVIMCIQKEGREVMRMTLDDKQVAELEAKAKKYDKMQAINKKSYQRRNAKIHLMLLKAEKAGIKVTEAEVDAYLKK